MERGKMLKRETNEVPPLFRGSSYLGTSEQKYQSQTLRDREDYNRLESGEQMRVYLFHLQFFSYYFLYQLIFARETEQIEYTYSYIRQDFFWALVYVIVEAKKSYCMPIFTSWRPRKTSGITQSKAKVLRTDQGWRQCKSLMTKV